MVREKIKLVSMFEREYQEWVDDGGGSGENGLVADETGWGGGGGGVEAGGGDGAEGDGRTGGGGGGEDLGGEAAVDGRHGAMGVGFERLYIEKGGKRVLERERMHAWQ